jgi:fibronectin type 3 domain-containing protein
MTGEGKNKLIYVPHIDRAIPNNKGGFDIRWEFDERGNSQISEFQLQRSDHDKGPFTTVIDHIAPLQRDITYDSLQSSNYFVIAAIPFDGDPVLSFPILIQPSDTVPPAIPVGLEGTIDSAGIVKLSWQANTEKDILGYRIYRAQTKGEELIPLNDVAVRDNHFYDTLDVKNLNSKAYYAVTSLDMRYNQSDKSIVAELLKPELVPPSSPVIINYKVSDQGILLEWVTGKEENLGEVRLYRQERGEPESKLIQSISDSTVHRYIDTHAEDNRYYTYTMQAVSQRGLASASSPALTIQSGGKSAPGKFIDFNAKRNRRNKNIVLWLKHDLKDVKEITVYKGENGKSVTMWKLLKGFELQVEDNDVQPDAQYEYVIRAVLINGKTGAVANVKIQN